jgi:carbamoyltransferase
MIFWGVNALNHGSSLAVFKEGKLISNRSSNDDELDRNAIFESLHSGAPDRIFWYERPWIKKARQLRAGQYRRALDLSVLPRKYLNNINLHYAPITYTPHHGSHAAAGYYTSPFNHCAVVVLDAIGEFECATIWEGKHGELKKVWSRSYPNSLGLYYSAFTDFLGMTPIKDEYLLQQMATKGDPTRFRESVKLYFDKGIMNFKYNFHKGIHDWSCETWNEQEKHDLAAAVQEQFEIQVGGVMMKARQLTGSDCLVYMGGCAMNSIANQNEVEPLFKYRWSLPNPGDPSSSVGAVLYHTKQRVWDYNFGVAKHLAISV